VHRLNTIGSNMCATGSVAINRSRVLIANGSFRRCNAHSAKLFAAAPSNVSSSVSNDGRPDEYGDWKALEEVGEIELTGSASNTEAASPAAFISLSRWKPAPVLIPPRGEFKERKSPARLSRIVLNKSIASSYWRRSKVYERIT